MATQTKCPSCDAELSINDDPILLELKASVDGLVKENAKLRDKLEAAGAPAPASKIPAAAAAASTKAKRRGIVTLLDDDDDDGDEA